MLRLLFRLVVLALLLVGGAVLYGVYHWGGASAWLGEGSDRSAATGVADGVIDRDRVRAAGAEIAHTVSVGAERAEAALAEARLTAKIKSKMALDDSIQASRLNVDTVGTVVTVRGTVDTEAQHRRALQLARETDGVTEVIDRVERTGR